jgi:DNA-binding transcriptional LysR family regulator
MWITLEQLICLKTLKQTGSLNAASEKLNKAKSAISYSINKLEEQVGFSLIDRSQYRVTLTDRGESFLNKSKKILENLEELKEEALKLSLGTEAKVCLSATAIYPTDKLNKILKELILKFPETEFTFHREILSGEKMLMNNSVDIAIFERIQNTFEIEFKIIAEILLKLVISQDHPFLKLPKKEQILINLARYPQIIQRSTIPDDTTFGILEDSKKWTVSDIDSKKDLILNNLGWGRLPDHYVEKDLKVKKLVHLKHLNYDHLVQVSICKRKGKNLGPASQYLWDSF